MSLSQSQSLGSKKPHLELLVLLGLIVFGTLAVEILLLAEQGVVKPDGAPAAAAVLDAPLLVRVLQRRALPLVHSRRALTVLDLERLGVTLPDVVCSDAVPPDTTRKHWRRNVCSEAESATHRVYWRCLAAVRAARTLL